mmetsp:Transcript_12686/g.57243  ORF Transcript_12686/g.57243 Transcript_12686/m.57243 type:complete len:200 (-) Transcript_12686:632-1231(-)
MATSTSKNSGRYATYVANTNADSVHNGVTHRNSAARFARRSFARRRAFGRTYRQTWSASATPPPTPKRFKPATGHSKGKRVNARRYRAYPRGSDRDFVNGGNGWAAIGSAHVAPNTAADAPHGPTSSALRLASCTYLAQCRAHWPFSTHSANRSAVRTSATPRREPGRCWRQLAYSLRSSRSSTFSVSSPLCTNRAKSS